jgi:hypothetical protein
MSLQNPNPGRGFDKPPIFGEPLAVKSPALPADHPSSGARTGTVTATVTPIADRSGQAVIPEGQKTLPRSSMLDPDAVTIEMPVVRMFRILHSVGRLLDQGALALDKEGQIDFVKKNLGNVQSILSQLRVTFEAVLQKNGIDPADALSVFVEDELPVPVPVAAPSTVEAPKPVVNQAAADVAHRTLMRVKIDSQLKHPQDYTAASVMWTPSPAGGYTYDETLMADFYHGGRGPIDHHTTALPKFRENLLDIPASEINEHYPIGFYRCPGPEMPPMQLLLRGPTPGVLILINLSDARGSEYETIYTSSFGRWTRAVDLEAGTGGLLTRFAHEALLFMALGLDPATA